jgi:molecular chaperone DnaJ
VDSRGYYKTLGLTEDASSDDIKKAFRKLSMQYHPDKTNGDKESEEKFKEINEAYSTLSNPEKKQQYDNPNVFGDLFGLNSTGSIFDNFMSFNTRRKPDPNRPMVGKELRYILDVPLIHFIFGGVMDMSMEYMDVCVDCCGKGFTSSKCCPNCNGTGVITNIVNQGNMRMHSSTACGVCRGRGEVGTEHCKVCGGRGSVVTTITHKVEIPKNSKDGDIIKLAEAGGKGLNGGPSGDLYIKLRMILPKAEDFNDEKKGQLIDLLV